MPTPINGKIIPFEKEMINRVNDSKTIGTSADFFGPSQPLKPVAPSEVKGRKLDYPTGFNLNYTPRREGNNYTNIDFETLRRVADPAQGGLDIVRLCIETIKDTVCGIEFEIVSREKDDIPNEAKIKAVTKRLQMPDGQNGWNTWLRPIIEDHLVIDQPAIYIRKTPERITLDNMDGALLKLLIDPSGRSPQPPYACYQQQIKGLPAVDYNSDELIVPIYNRRSNKIYGYSRVEQIVNIINLGLRRQLSQLEYWRAGNVPDMLIGVPDTWNVDQIAQYQQWFDSILDGNLANRRKARFIPSDAKPFPVTEPPLKGELDEWVARIVSYCFSVPHDWAVKDMNRATAEVSAQSSKEQGLTPIKKWIEGLMNEILIKAFDAPELKFSWKEQDATDPRKQMEILQIAVGSRIMTIDEAREQLGLAPMPQESEDNPLSVALNELQGKQPAPFGDPIETEEDEDEEVETVQPFVAQGKISKKKRLSSQGFSY